jgi:hypothetical protein
MGSEHKCDAGVIKAKTLCNCSNTAMNPIGICGPLVAKIPVVIAEPVVQIDVEADIKLEHPALEIKRIKKNVFITQCKLIDLGCENKGKLFISGYVRKNIEYATADCSCIEKKSISGEIKHTTVNVPFTCVSEIEYKLRPHIKYQKNSVEVDYFSDKTHGNEFCGQKIMGVENCEQGFKHKEIFNEKVYCELEEATIFEEDILRCPESFGHEFPTESIFESIVEKMVIHVRLKLLQLQQVNIPNEYPQHKENEKYSK